MIQGFCFSVYIFGCHYLPNNRRIVSRSLNIDIDATATNLLDFISSTYIAVATASEIDYVIDPNSIMRMPLPIPLDNKKPK